MSMTTAMEKVACYATCQGMVSRGGGPLPASRHATRASLHLRSHVGKPLHFSSAVSPRQTSLNSATPSTQAGRGAKGSRAGARGPFAVHAMADGAGDEAGSSSSERFASEGQDGVMLECDESGCAIVINKGKVYLSESEDEGQLRCDLTGCFFVDSTGEMSNEFKLEEGEGWRIGYETCPKSEESFAAIVGAGGWSIALTAVEYNDFCSLIQGFRKSIATLEQDGLTGKEDVVLEADRGSVWMECSMPKKRLPALQNLWKLGGRSNGNETSAFEIRFVLSGAAGRRQAEGYWPAEAIMDMLKKVDAARGAAAANGSANGASASNATAEAFVEERSTVAAT